MEALVGPWMSAFVTIVIATLFWRVVKVASTGYSEEGDMLYLRARE